MRTKQNITKKEEEERYLGIVIPQLPGKDVKGWCISWIEGKVIPVFTSAREKKRHRHDTYKTVQRVGSCDHFRSITHETCLIRITMKMKKMKMRDF